MNCAYAVLHCIAFVFSWRGYTSQDRATFDGLPPGARRATSNRSRAPHCRYATRHRCHASWCVRPRHASRQPMTSHTHTHTPPHTHTHHGHTVGHGAPPLPHRRDGADLVAAQGQPKHERRGAQEDTPFTLQGAFTSACCTNYYHRANSTTTTIIVVHQWWYYST